MPEKELRMPYGKFKDKKITDLPSKYLLWVAANWSEDTTQNKAICKAADEEYTYREETNRRVE